MQDASDNQIIEQLYDLISQPDQYDEFMLSLQKKLESQDSTISSQASSAITSHMKRAAALIDVVTPWRRHADEELHQKLLQKMQATLAVDELGHILDANAAAKVVYDLVPGMTLSDLPLDANSVDLLAKQLSLLIAVPEGRNSPNDVIRFQNPETGKPILVRLERYQPSGDRRPVAILRTNDIGWPSHLGPILQDLFDLTRTEVDVIRLIVEGNKVKEVARRRRTSPATVRSQLQTIFAKTDTADQMECVKMIFGLALMHDQDEGRLVAARIQAAQQTAFFPREDQRHIFKLPDGRLLDYSVFGADEGQTLLFYHDQAFGDVWFKEAVTAAKRAGLRVIAPLRPGFGHTTVYQGDASEPRDFARMCASYWIMKRLIELRC